MNNNVKNTINVRIIIFVVVSLVIALYTFAMIFGYSGAAESGHTTDNKEARGYYIFSTLLKRLGYKIQSRDFYTEYVQDGALVYFHYKENQKKDFERIKQWVAKGNILFLIGMDGENDPFFGNKMIMSETGALTLDPSLRNGVDTFSFESRIYFESESRGEILIGNPQGGILVKNGYDRGIVYLCSDPGLFTNRNLADENNAVVLNNLVKEYYEYPLFVHEQKFSGSAHPVVPLFRGKLFYITIHLILMGIIFILCYSIRFGNPINSNPLVRRTLQEHLNAVGNFYQKARALALTDIYGSRYFTDQVKRMMGIKKKISHDELAFLLKKRYIVDYSEREIASLLKETDDRSEKNLLHKRKQRSEFIEKLRKLKNRVNGKSLTGKTGI